MTSYFRKSSSCGCQGILSSPQNLSEVVLDHPLVVESAVHKGSLVLGGPGHHRHRVVLAGERSLDEVVTVTKL